MSRLLRSYIAIPFLALSLSAALPALAAPTLPGFDETVVAQGLSYPTGIAFLPDGRFLAAEEGGGIYVCDGVNAPQFVQSIPVAFPCYDYEIGLLGIAVDPDFNQNGYVYLYRTNDHGGDCAEPPVGWTNEVVRVTMANNQIDLGSLVVILPGIRCDSGYHNGGGLRIGPDGKLYIGVGENGIGDFTGAGPGTSTNPYSQDLDELEGKVLRINIPDGSIPNDNPYANQSGKRGEIWASGLRNPWRFSFDETTGKLWLGDVGEEDFEELDIVTKGGNYSWPHCEGNEPTGCREQGETAPIFTYSHHGSGAAIMGGAISGCAFGSLSGYYFYGDEQTELISMVLVNDTRDGVVGSSATFVTDAGGPVDIVFGPDGSMYYAATYWGAIRRVSATSVGGGGPVSAKKILLKDGDKKALQILSLDESIGICGSNPTITGASVRVLGNGFDNTYELPASGWTPIVKKGRTRGYNYKDPDLVNGPIHVAQLKNGKIKVYGKGDGLGHVLGETAPTDLDIALFVGAKQYCIESMGTPSRFTPFKLMKATNVPAPVACKM